MNIPIIALPRTQRRSLLIGLLLAAIVLPLSGCGFQPRGVSQNLAAIPSPLYIAGLQPHSALHRELRRQLEQSGVTTSTAMADTASVLRVSRWERDSRLLSVDSTNKAVEYELEESARVSLHTIKGTELLPEQTARVVRIQFRPKDAVLASEREAELLRADMRKDLAAQIVRRLAR